MAKLQKLINALNSAQNATGKVLDITASTFPSELGEVKNFFAEVLSASALKIEKSGSKPLIATDTPSEGHLTVQGQAGLFDLPKANLTLEFSEPTEGQLDVAASVVFPKNVQVKIGFLPQLDLTSDKQDVQLDLVKTGSEFHLHVAGVQGKPIQLPGVAAVAKLTEGANFADLLPESLVNVVNGIAFNELTADFDPKKKTVSLLDVSLQYLFGSNQSGNWKMAPGVLMQDLRFQLTVENAVPAAGQTRSASGAAFGNLKIGGVQMPLEFRSANADAELWQAKIQEGETVALPTLGGLLETFLDEDTVAVLPPQLTDLPGVTVNALTLEFDPKKKSNPKAKTIKNLQFDLSAEDEWPIVPDYLALQGNALNFTFENLLDATERKIFGEAKSSLVVASAPFEFLLKKEADGEAWQMEGHLAEGQKFKLSAFANQFLHDFAIPADLPDLDIDTATFTLDLRSKKLSFESASTEGMTIVEGYGINGLGVGIERTPGATPTAKAEMTAALTGTVLAAGIDLNLLAQMEPKSGGQGKALKFESTAAEGKDIPIGELVSSLAAFGQIDPPPSLDSVAISDLRASYLPGSEMTFGFVTEMETDAKNLTTDILLRLTKQPNGSYAKAFEGVLTVGEKTGTDEPLKFELLLTDDGDSGNMYATLRPGQLGSLSLSNLFKKFVGDNDFIPDVEVSLVSAFLNITKAKVEPAGGNAVKAKAKLFFGVEIAADMTFGDGLPLVGPMLDGQSIGVKTVLFSYATASITLKEIQKINLSLPKGKPNMPKLPKLPEVELSGGIGLSFSMAFGKLSQYISLPVAKQPEPASPGTPPPPLTEPEEERGGKWFGVNKRLGPVSIARVGVNFQDKVLTFGLDASLALGPLTLLLEEFTFGSRIDRFEPHFGMRGFGIGYEAGPVEISGFFLRKISTTPGVSDEYTGAALIKTPKLTLKAIGAFAMVQGEPSFYLYAYLGYPIGGPAFFFVEGLAAGFGFNRSVKMPAIGKVKEFPLVAIAVGEEEFLGVAKRMATGNFVPIDPGKLFLAVGIRFTTFKQLDSFVLLIATLGKDYFRLDLLGLSKLTVPSPGPGAKNPVPLAEVELAIKGTFAPVEGFVGVQAQLTRNSYVLSRDCYLTGGFAFFTWFGDNPHAGDFVISLGGYHPKFQRPSHYPVVPRLGFNWQVSSTINVKGGMYFALTPTVVMAGGFLDATFESGIVEARLKINADFIIGWKPYFYDARVKFSASGTVWLFFPISFDVGVDLHVWGPEFSGTATIDLGIFEFTVEFGAGALQTSRPIPYIDFKESFLPSANVATVSATDGLLQEIGEVWVVNPKDFAMTTDSAIPSTETISLKKVSYAGQSIYLAASADFFTYRNDPEGWDTSKALPFPLTEKRTLSDIKVEEVESDKFNPDIGIGTVGVKTGQLETSHSVEIFKGNDDYTAEFLYEHSTKSYPAALWGDKLLADKNDSKRVIANALSGLKIKPKPPADPDQMGFLDQDEFKFQTLTIGNAFLVKEGFGFAKSEGGASVPGEHAPRAALLRAMGFGTSDFEIDESTDFGLTHDPAVVEYASLGQLPR